MPGLKRSLILSLLGVGLIYVSAMSPASASCGAAYCSVNTDLDAHGISPEPGLRLGLRYEYINQETLRSGRDKVAPQGVPGTHDELYTHNRNALANLDYVFASGWGMSAQVPAVGREHAHIHNDPLTGPEQETWDYTDLGDMKMIGRYQVGSRPFSAPGVRGVKFGIKLPTGRINEANTEGAVAERSLQPGSGSTDIIVAAYGTRGFVNSSVSFFAQTLWQHAIATRDSYRPGDQLSFDLGVSYPIAKRASAILQANALIKARDEGANAEPEDSGGRFLNLSPGLTYRVLDRLFAYSFLQRPLYQYVNGVQLTADWAAVVGATYQF